MKKILCIILSLIMLLSAFPVVSLAVTNPYPINNYNSTGEWSNCTWSVWKLVYDNLGIALPAWGNAGSWYNNAQKSGYSVGSTPKINSIICYNGHVAFVTGISSDGSKVYIKEGGYGSDPNLGYHEGYSNAYGSREYTGQKIYGYIYLNVSSGEMTYPTIATDKEFYLPGETINISWTQTSFNTDFYQYWLVIEGPNGQAINNSATGGAGDVTKNSFSFQCSKVGDYKIAVWAVPYNDKANRQKFDVKYIKVVENSAMIAPTIYLDKEQYYVGDTINVKWAQASDDTDFYQYWLVIEDPEGRSINNSATGAAGDVTKNKFNFTASTEGPYYISVWSVPYNNKAERQRFESATINVKNRNENTTTEPNEDLIKNCSCNCHSSGFMNLIFRIILFIQKIFKMNAVCTCGIAHY